MRRLTKVEKMIIATTSNLTTYDCEKCGIIQITENSDKATCPRCKQPLILVDGVEKLKEKYRKELGLD